MLERLAERLARTGQGLILVSHRPAPLALCEQRLTVTDLSPSGAVRASLEADRATA